MRRSFCSLIFNPASEEYSSLLKVYADGFDSRDISSSLSGMQLDLGSFRSYVLNPYLISLQG